MDAGNHFLGEFRRTREMIDADLGLKYERRLDVVELLHVTEALDSSLKLLLGRMGSIWLT
ncbi:hypothetical protein [Actinokineospora cianjurensis]|uniref:Uncharacterized protein n=1 Tax=Actinokineospora cianjurensis TaxID=585224 RepID=A0A421B2Y6_9PSEU|nr:hypothetical protein [Actinokineospora cianjurensis]RLK58772.1 hypothetical protein CLV68_3247 [Actinokineospora cianjurensis]